MIANNDIEMLKNKHDVIVLDRMMIRGSGKESEDVAIALVALDDPFIEDDEAIEYTKFRPSHFFAVYYRVRKFGKSG